jgi:hypothetical protein
MEMNATAIINCPVEKLAAYVLDVANDTHWRYKVDESGFRSGDAHSPGSIGFTRVGELEVNWKILSSDAKNSVDWEFLNGPFKGSGGYRFKQVEGGTQFTLVSNVKPTGIYRILGLIFRWVGRRRNQSDVEKLRKILES